MDLKELKQVLVGFIMMLSLGISYTWSIFELPLEQSFGWSRSQTSMAFSLFIICFTIGILLTGWLIKKYSYKLLIRVSAFFILAGFYLSTIIVNIYQLYLTFSVLVGLNVGICYNIILSIVTLWCPKSVGKTTGVLVMGYALSTSILSPLCKLIITLGGWKSALVCVGVISFIILEVGAFFLQDAATVNETNNVVYNGNNMTTKEMLHSKNFFIFFIYIILLGGTGLSLMNHLSLAIDYNFNISKYVAIMLSLFSLCNGIGRIIWGAYFDLVSIPKFLKTIAIFYLVFIILIISGLLCKSIVFTIISGCLLIFSYGGLCMAIPASSRGLFGNEHFSVNYSICNLATVIGAIIPSIVGFIFDISLSYVLSFLALFVLCVLAFVISMMIRKVND